MTLKELKEKNRTLALILEILDEWLQDVLICDAQREILTQNIETLKLVGDNEIVFYENMQKIEGFNYAIETSRS